MLIKLLTFYVLLIVILACFSCNISFSLYIFINYIYLFILIVGGGRGGTPRGGGARGGGRGGGRGRGAPRGGMKGGAKVVVTPHRHAGILLNCILILFV